MSEPIGQLKDKHGDYRTFLKRILLSFFFVLVLFIVIFTRFYNLQVTNYADHTTQSDRNRIHRQAVPATRGLIFDRNGELLAENRPSYSLTIVRERVKDLDSMLSELRKLVSITDQQIEKFKQRPRIPFQSVPLRYNLSETDIAIIGVNRYRLPGVEVEARLVRHYPHAEIFAHTIGYVGRINERELKEIDRNAYQGLDTIGKRGIEKFYERELLGIVGYQDVETNARGRVIKVLKRHDPVPGKNLITHLDLGMQRVAYEAVKGERAAVVALDVKTGGVLAIVSTPSFDSNLFVTGISINDYKELRDSPDLPLFNRTMQGQYPPGSTIKPVLGLLGLETGVVNEHTTIYDPGWYQLENDDRRYRDWKRYGHGKSVDLRQAIAQSCDVFYYDMAFKLGIDRIHKFMVEFGLGDYTSIDQTSERPGLMPSRDWKKHNRGQPWFPGETLNTGIGQGYMLMTPIQLAVMTSILASRGERILPRVLKQIIEPLSEQNGQQQLAGVEFAEMVNTNNPIILQSTANWEYIFQAMEDVVHNRKGTAHGISKGATYRMAGKTGTAQVVGIAQDDKYDSSKLEKHKRDHALFVGFAPLEDPQVAVAVIVENGEHGSSSAAPVARKLFDTYLLGRQADMEPVIE